MKLHCTIFCIFRYLRIVPGFLLIVAIAVGSVNIWINDADLPMLIAIGGIVFTSFFMLFIEYVYSSFEGMNALIFVFKMSIVITGFYCA